MSDLLIHNAVIWPAADVPPIPGGSILVRAGRIAKVGVFHARAETVIDAGGALAIPGLVQAHVHLCQTLFRSAAENMVLLDWLRERIWPLEAAHDPDSIHASASLAAAEMIRSGVTAFLSMETAHYTDAAFEAVDEAGLCGAIGHCLMDETGSHPALAVKMDDYIADCDILLDRYERHPRLRLAVAPRFALSVSEKNLRLCGEYAREYKLRLHTHASEQLAEVELVRRRTGRYNVDYLHRLGLSGPHVGLAHCVHLQPEEIDLLAETGTHVLHCPSANLKLGSGVAPVPELLRREINVALGSDGAPCNNRLDLFSEMRLAALLQKPLHGPAALTPAEVFHMATQGGADALGWGDEMGSLEEGKRANIVLVDREPLHVLPSVDIAADLVYAHQPADVQLTMVDGKILFENGHLTTLDEAQLRVEVRREREKLFRRAGIG